MAVSWSCQALSCLFLCHRLNLALILTDLQAASAPAISSMLHAIGWRTEEDVSPSLLLKHPHIVHILVSIFIGT